MTRARHDPADRQQLTSRRRSSGPWVWATGSGGGKSGLGAPRWKRISARPTDATAECDAPAPPAPAAAVQPAPPSAAAVAPPEKPQVVAKIPALPEATAPASKEVASKLFKHKFDERPRKGKKFERWAACEASDRLDCPAGHALKQRFLELPSICSVCSGEFAKGLSMWSCFTCDFDRCGGCRLSALSGKDVPRGGLGAEDRMALAKSPGSPSVLSSDSLESTQENASSADTFDFNGTTLSACDDWWQGEGHFGEWNHDFGEMHLAEASPSDSTSAGPDGEWYEIFYSPDGLSEKECIAHGAGGGQLLKVVDHEALACRRPQFQSAVSSSAVPHKTSADIGIADMVAYMSKIAFERYPARSHLFKLVKEAAAEALEGHFERCALIGSTALGIDTPDSDLDAVVFTQSVEAEDGTPSPCRGAVEALRSIRAALAARDGTLQLQLVDCTRVPVLTVVTSDAKLSLDLTVDEPLGERHVLWFQRQAHVPDPYPAPLYQVPVPSPDAWAQGLEAAVLRCVKWWLRRRAIPVAKEGGYPSVVWTLMVLHVLRCSMFLNGMDHGDNRGRSVLTAMASFFDRFAESGLVGTFRFADGKSAESWQQQLEDMTWPQMGFTELSVLDPTTTGEENAASGGQPLELAPRLSTATQLLHTHELRRAQFLSAAALMSNDHPVQHECFNAWTCCGGATLQHLFSEAGDSNVLPAALPREPKGAVVFSNGKLSFGVVNDIRPKPGWGASFLHRRDTHSRFSLQVCAIEVETGVVRVRSDLHLQWFRPCDFVCLLPVRPSAASQPTEAQAVDQYELDMDSLERWCDMRMLVHGETVHRSPGTVRGSGGRGGGSGPGRRRAGGCRQQVRP